MIPKMNFRLVAILTIIGGGLLYLTCGNVIISLKSPVDFTKVAAEEIKPRIRAEGEVYAVLDYFAEEETWTENKDGSTTPKKKSSKYFVIPVGENKFMAIEGFSRDFAAFDTIIENTTAYMMGKTDTLDKKTLPFVGTVEKLDDELLQYFKEWFVDTEYLGTTNISEINEYILPYMLVNRSFTAVWISFGIGVLLLALDAVYLILFFKKKKKIMDQQTLEMSA